MKNLAIIVVLLIQYCSFAIAQGHVPPQDTALSSSGDLKADLPVTFVKGGCYTMGDNDGDGFVNEKPAHEACVEDFYIGRYLVTQDEWKSVMGANPSHSSCKGSCPVENISWNDIQKFLYILSDRTGKKYRLPTEAEWEYAARSGGKNEKWAGTGVEDDVPDYAWIFTNSDFELHPVGQKKPNGLGLYDMSGDAWEWVSDWYGGEYYRRSPKNNPQGPATGTQRTLRGGYWGDMPKGVRVSRRIGLDPDSRVGGYGFRVAVSTR